MNKLLAPAEVDDAIAYGFAKLACTPAEQLQAEAEAHRVRKGMPPSELPPELDALLYGIAKLINGTPLGQLKAEADSFRAARSLPRGVPWYDDLDGRGQQPSPGLRAHVGAVSFPTAHEAAFAASVALAASAAPAALERGMNAIYQALTRQILHATPEHPYGLASDATLRPDWLTWWKARAAPFFKDFQNWSAKRSPERWSRFGPNIAPYVQWHKRLIDLHKEAEVLGILAPSKMSSDAGEKVSGAASATYNAPYLGESTMSIEHYRATAIQAVTGTQQHNPSPVYGYLRQGVQQKIYLFPNDQDAHAWFDQRGHAEPGYDYIAVFSAANLHAPVVEDLGAAVPHPANVGHWALPFALGLPAGGLAGYHLRKWQEEHPGKTFPWISGDPSVGGEPWQSIVGADPSVGGPWVDIVGAQAHLHSHTHVEARHHQPWLTTKALIQSAIDEVVEASSMAPAAAYVWSLDPPGSSMRPGVELTGTTIILPFASYSEALDYVRSRHDTPFVAMAVFDQANRWPNPVNWTKSHAPEHESLIAQQIAKHASTRMAGDFVGAEWQSIVGGEPWQSIVGAAGGQALDVQRRQAKAAAEEMPGNVVAVRRGANGRWKLKAFRSVDDADDWFGHAIAEPSDFTYAAYFSKDRHGIPFLENEQVGRASRARREIASATVAP